MDPSDVFKSERLCYRAFEPEDDAMLYALQADTTLWGHAYAGRPLPANKKAATDYRELHTTSPLTVVICLRSDTKESKDVDANEKRSPKEPMQLGEAASVAAPSLPSGIGFVSLVPSSPAMAVRREHSMGIQILATYQGQGYGTETIRWILEYGFNIINLHRVALSVYEYNEGAIRLYERLGFVQEQRKREALFHKGKWWDHLGYGMLKREWLEMQRI